MTIESILGSQFKCQVKEMVNFSKYDAVIPVVRETIHWETLVLDGSQGSSRCWFQIKVNIIKLVPYIHNFYNSNLYNSLNKYTALYFKREYS